MTPSKRPLRHSPAVLFTAFAAAFLTFRLGLLTVGTTASEYRLYYEYGDAARRTSLDALVHERDVEYPQLAVLFGTLTCWVADRLPAASERWLYARPNPTGPADYARFESALAIVLFAVDLACLALVAAIARTLYPKEAASRRAMRLGLYTVTTGALGLILYDRQDLVVALFALLALFAFVRGWSFPGYVLLTVATAYKLVGALLLPVWVFAAAALRAGPGASPQCYLRAVLVEGAKTAAVLALWPLFTYEFGGRDRAFTFLTFHSARGLQVEAPFAWPAIAFDSAAEVTHGYGGFNFRSPFADALARALKWAMIASTVLGAAFAGRVFWRQAAAAPRPAPAALGPLVVLCSLFVWFGFIVANKVGSPQYFLWVAPLIPLLPLRRGREWGWVALVLVLFALTTAVYPCAYDFVKGDYRTDRPGTWTGPNVWMKAVLTARSLAVFAVVLWLGASVWRAGRRVPTPALSPARSTSHEPDPAAGPVAVGPA